MQGVCKSYWVLMKHEVMRPNLTVAEGFILGMEAKMFPLLRCPDEMFRFVKIMKDKS